MKIPRILLTTQRVHVRARRLPRVNRSRALQIAYLAVAILAVPALAHAQTGSPFDTGLTNLQGLFTGTVARVGSLIAFVVSGVAYAMGEPGAKKGASGALIGSGIAVLSTQVMNYFWGA